MWNTEKYIQTVALVETFRSIVNESLWDNIPIDVVIESLAVVLSATMCEKHQVCTHDAMSTTKQVVEAVSKIILENKIDPTLN